MPRGDGQGPVNGGRRRGGGRMGGNRPSTDGYCICPACDTRTPHKQATPCNQLKCPNCNQTMRRE